MTEASKNGLVLVGLSVAGILIFLDTYSIFLGIYTVFLDIYKTLFD